ncbi:hypothetical protein AGABI1DRAFT_132917 [Agaricus bisporus var. burnettii JB137-S8]|uniref:Uncharacterized protein n=1 Tax=Agaricus bisporus var. burnettii (strain JB137-S8 / ATCC MYA-4627 / FGSC 10392) TaxID=597362 RepID=K5WVC6_AGABU|nr:uncharacterized protein AGABI1DRAFT_132917 [Agaricus bisporus var. burnettii JB137-S8]EKM74728.1 hypothetical protein AGABI1DRAFT_132917 [Agaricus bisporus var. burnettii JB137-S8]
MSSIGESDTSWSDPRPLWYRKPRQTSDEAPVTNDVPFVYTKLLACYLRT